MQRLMMYLLALVVSALPAVANAWWQPDWKYRKQVSIDTTQQGAAINEPAGRVPLLVRLHTGNFTFDGVNANGSDLRFVAADDQTVLNYQIESFDPLLGMAVVWVDVSEVSGAQRQDIWMYYGNEKAPVASNGQVTFDPNYTLVYHFNGAPEAPPRDATGYNNNAQTPVAGMVDGVVGRAAQFTGAAPLMLPASPSLAMAAGSAFTFSAWVRADQPSGDQAIYARRDAGNSLVIGVSSGVPFVEVNGQRTQPGQPLTPAAWQHVAVTANGGQITLYVNGRASGTLTASLPALNTAAAVGGDVAVAAPAAPAVPADPAAAATAAAPAAAPAPAATYAAFVGAIDEIRLSKIARPAALIFADATAQGSESRMVVYGADEEQSGMGFGELGFLLNAVPLDAWVVIGVLILMMIQSWVIMVSKSRLAKRVEVANSDFRTVFAKVGNRLEMLADETRLNEQLKNAPLWRLYSVAVNEIRVRRAQGADTNTVSAATIEAIRASMDAIRTKESQMLGKRLSALSNAIAGGPYIGLLGTVLGIMVVFLGTAMAGDVNINAIAPGMAAALLATAMGLFVAIPALFGYNRLITRNKEINADMRVFVDEFITRLAEVHGEGSRAEAMHANQARVATA
ncbi:TolQ-like translocation protein [Bordetella ansorpii]|uniref:TolQ-like translocation protein n=1 Tax=Bordetella ansorpii TaxID=288768 RepID=A0A146AR00_9BORD|nr:MotA/TolQ/ExbB proton channel family protein [Bordetella ansorpii]CZZ90984.1 TolQ-like translocation protein [Bordetella ansorpii]